MAEQRKMNPFILVFVGIIIMFLLYVSLKNNTESYTEIKTLPHQYSDKSEDGDTQADTIRALQAYAKEAVEKAKTLNEKTLTQSQQVDKNKHTVSSLEKDSQQNREALQKAREETRMLQEKLTVLHDKLEVLIDEKQHATAELPVGFGFELSTEHSQNTQGQWYQPIDLIEEAKGEKASSDFKGLLRRPTQLKEKADQKSATEQAQATAENIEPYFTLHKDAILFDALAFTALIGRIPVEGVTPDPYPVKIFIGKENLLANGFDLPDVEGMVFSGLGVGDWNLSCVSARLYSATFIFNDGRIVNQTEREPLAYISDRTGVPCVSGRFVSNAKQFIAQQVALSGLGAAGSAYASAQLETTDNLEGSRATSLIGSIRKLLAGNVVKSSTNEVSAWLLARQKQSFEAVVVDPGKQVSVHLEKTIMLDHKEFARKVRYADHTHAPVNTLD